MISIDCHDCGSNYSVKDQHAGKKFRCTQCESILQVPGGEGGSSSLSPAQRQQVVETKPPASEQYDEYNPYATDDDESYDDYGSSDDDQSSNDDDHDGYQSSQEHASSGASSDTPEQSFESVSGDDRGSSVSGHRLDVFCEWRVFIGVPLLTCVLVPLLSLFPVVGIVFMFLVVLVCAGVMTVGSVLGIVEAFQEGPVCGILYLFLPLYPLYFTITRWKQTRGAFMMSLTATLTLICPMIVGIGMLVAGTAADPAGGAGP